jgi:hypothetical protein
MPYRFAVERQDYSDYASGRVLHHLPGAPAFPVRLAQEVFLRGLDLLKADGPVTLYDPCCGAASHLTALGWLHAARIAEIFASDPDEAALSAARRNLSLLTAEGLDRRIAEIRGMHERFGKDSHADALISAERLRERLAPVRSTVFRADALLAGEVRAGLGGKQPGLVLADVPYGWKSSWSGAGQAGAQEDPLGALLEALTGVLAAGAVVAIASDKSQKARHPAYDKAGKMRAGKRLVTFMVLTGAIPS